MEVSYEKMIMVLCCVILYGNSISVEAKELQELDKNKEMQESTMVSVIDLSKLELGEKIILEDGAILTPITVEEYAKVVENEKSIPIDETLRLEEIAKSSSSIYYYTYTKQFSYPQNSGFKATMEATIKCSRVGVHTQIQAVYGLATRGSAGTYSYTWIQTAAFYDAPYWPANNVKLFGRGYFEVNTALTGSISGGLPGFSVSASTTNNIIYRSDTLYMNGQFQAY